MAAKAKRCTECGEPIGPGGAKGLCATHYQQKRRTGSTASTRTPTGEGDRLMFRVPSSDRELVEKAAQDTGQTVAQWLRDAVRGALIRQEGRRLGLIPSRDAPSHSRASR